MKEAACEERKQRLDLRNWPGRRVVIFVRNGMSVRLRTSFGGAHCSDSPGPPSSLKYSRLCALCNIKVYSKTHFSHGIVSPSYLHLLHPLLFLHDSKHKHVFCCAHRVLRPQETGSQIFNSRHPQAGYENYSQKMC